MDFANKPIVHSRGVSRERMAVCFCDIWHMTHDIYILKYAQWSQTNCTADIFKLAPYNIQKVNTKTETTPLL